MAIRRENIPSLIGNGRYHSCILTTFSFDFYFFEFQVIKWLRSCNIRNVNVFLDGYYYAELMQQATGDEMKFATGYSLYPIFSKGLFHPKIWMLFGEEEGMLVVGSGNLTYSGNGGNDEIWGAFHFDGKRREHAGLFASAWDYLSQISGTVRGIVADKTTRWIAEHSPWLSSLPKVSNGTFSGLPNGEQAAFLFNQPGNGILKQAIALLGNEKVTEVTIASPFYDTKGKAIEAIQSAFRTASINIVVEETGALPHEMTSAKKCSFYDWKNLGVCRTMGVEQKSRLHGKLLHLKTQKGTEYCLLGSANFTPEGVGMANNSNAEACLLIKASKGGLLDRTGIKLKPGSKRTLASFKAGPRFSIYQAVIKNNRFPIRLLAVDSSYGILSIYSEGEPTEGMIIALYDENNSILAKMPVDEYKPAIEWKADIDEARMKFVQFIHEKTGQPVSNKILVSNYLIVAKTHPSPKYAELEQLCSRLQNGELRNVLDLIQYAIIDETEKVEGAVVKPAKPILKREKGFQKSDVLYDIAGYKPIEKNAFNEKNILLSPSLRVLDVLKVAHYQETATDNGIRVDEQQEDIASVAGNEEGEINRKQTTTLRLLDSDRRKLKNFFRNLYGYFHFDVLYKDNKVSDYQLSLTDFTKYLIALELIHEFGGKSEMVEDQQRQLFFTYLPQTGEYDNDNVKGCCLNIIGDFLRLARNGFKAYEFEYTRKKFDQLRRDALISTITCVLNTAWKDNESMYMKTLLLNAIHYLGWNSSVELARNRVTLQSDVDTKLNHLKQRCPQLEEHRLFFHNRVCNAFEVSTKKRENRLFVKQAGKGQIIYSSIAGLGYCYVVSVSSKNEYQLARPGFAWNQSAAEYMNHFGDVVYRPILLPQVTVVEI